MLNVIRMTITKTFNRLIFLIRLAHSKYITVRLRVSLEARKTHQGHVHGSKLPFGTQGINIIQRELHIHHCSSVHKLHRHTSSDGLLNRKRKSLALPQPRKLDKSKTVKRALLRHYAKRKLRQVYKKNWTFQTHFRAFKLDFWCA